MKKMSSFQSYHRKHQQRNSESKFIVSIRSKDNWKTLSCRSELKDSDSPRLINPRDRAYFDEWENHGSTAGVSESERETDVPFPGVFPETFEKCPQATLLRARWNFIEFGGRCSPRAKESFLDRLRNICVRRKFYEPMDVENSHVCSSPIGRWARRKIKFLIYVELINIESTTKRHWQWNVKSRTFQLFQQREMRIISIQKSIRNMYVKKGTRRGTLLRKEGLNDGDNRVGLRQSVACNPQLVSFGTFLTLGYKEFHNYLQSQRGRSGARHS